MSSDLDLIIHNGRIVDGTGKPSFIGSVGVKGTSIAAIGALKLQAPSVLDASGCIVSPGFIDAHSNLTWGLHIDPSCRIAISQGITTAISGNCGGSNFPCTGPAKDWITKAGQDYGVMASWNGLHDLAAVVGKLAIDVMPMVGHGTLRAASAGFVNRGLNPEELVRLRRLLSQCFDDGARGISFGLAYPPGAFADHAELLACCEDAAARDKVCCFHIRIESDGLEEAVEEIIELAKSSVAACLICHHKALGPNNWGKTQRTLRSIDEACRDGARIFLDTYPYTTALRNVAMLLPDWAHEGGRGRLVERLEDLQLRKRLVTELRQNVERWNASWSDTIIWEAPNTPELHGVRADTVIARSGEDGILDLLLENNGRLLTLYEGASLDDLDRVAIHPRTMVGSDGNAQRPDERGHPRSFATFPRFLNEVVARRALMSVEVAIAKMTSLPADFFAIGDRGRIQTGLRADLCVFPAHIPDAIADANRALEEPWPRHLVVAGKTVIENGQITAHRPGSMFSTRSLALP